MQLSSALQSMLEAHASPIWAQVDWMAHAVQAIHEPVPSQPPVPEALLVAAIALLDCAFPVVAPV